MTGEVVTMIDVLLQCAITLYNYYTYIHEYY